MSAATPESVPAFRRPSTSESSSNESSELNGRTVELIFIQDPNGFNKAIDEARTKRNEETKKCNTLFIAEIVGILAYVAIAIVAAKLLAAPYILLPVILISGVGLNSAIFILGIKSRKHGALAEQAKEDEFEFRTCRKDVQTGPFKDFLNEVGKSNVKMPFAQLRDIHEQFRIEQAAKKTLEEAMQARGRLLASLNS